MSVQSYRARILAALDDRDVLDLSHAQIVEVLKEVAGNVEVRIARALEAQVFEEALTPVVGEELAAEGAR